MAADVGKIGGNGKGSRGMRVSARSCQSIPVLNKIRAEAQRSLRRFFTRSRGAAERMVRPDRPVFRSGDAAYGRSEEHQSEIQSLMRISYAVFCLKKKKQLPLKLLRITLVTSSHYDA